MNKNNYLCDQFLLYDPLLCVYRVYQKIKCESLLTLNVISEINHDVSIEVVNRDSGYVYALWSTSAIELIQSISAHTISYVYTEIIEEIDTCVGSYLQASASSVQVVINMSNVYGDRLHALGTRILEGICRRFYTKKPVFIAEFIEQAYIRVSPAVGEIYV